MKDDSHQSHPSVMATLALIGGLDNRPRLGGAVIHQDWGSGTISGIASTGKVSIQCHDLRITKICRLAELQVVGVFCLNTVGFRARSGPLFP